MAKITLEFGRTPDGRIGFKGLAEFTGDAGVDAVTSQITQNVESMLISMGVERNTDALNITEKE